MALGLPSGKQTAGPYTETIDGNTKRVFEPHQGRDILVNDPTIEPFSAAIIEDNDLRFSLGTTRLNDKGLWEGITLNESLSSTIFNVKSVDFDLQSTVQKTIDTPDGKITMPLNPDPTRGEYRTIWRGSTDRGVTVDALPYKIKTDENLNKTLVPLVLYHDKELHEDDYYASTEGKVNLRLFLKASGRDNENYNIKNYDSLNDRGMRIIPNAEAYQDFVQDGQYYRINTPHAWYVANLNWGDGTPSDHADEPFQISLNNVFEHEYDKPGFYTITGIFFYARDILNKKGKFINRDESKVWTWERFECNILVNESDEYQDGLYRMNNFCTIGGVSDDSAFGKTIKQFTGYNSDSPQGVYNYEALNELDKVNMLDSLAKLNSSLLITQDNDLLDAYSKEIDGELKDLTLQDIDYGEEGVPPSSALYFGQNVIGTDSDTRLAYQTPAPYVRNFDDNSLQEHFAWTNLSGSTVIIEGSDEQIPRYVWSGVGRGVKIQVEINEQLFGEGDLGQEAVTPNIEGVISGESSRSVNGSLNNGVQSSGYNIYKPNSEVIIQFTYAQQTFIEAVGIKGLGIIGPDLESNNGIIEFHEQLNDTNVQYKLTIPDEIKNWFQDDTSVIPNSDRAFKTIVVRVDSASASEEGGQGQQEDENINYLAQVQYRAYIREDNGDLTLVSFGGFLTLQASVDNNNLPVSGVGDGSIYESFSDVPNFERTFSAFAEGGTNPDGTTYAFEEWIVPDTDSTANGNVVGSAFQNQGNFRADSEGILVVAAVFAPGVGI